MFNTVQTVHCNTALSMHKNKNIQQGSIDFSLNYFITIISAKSLCKTLLRLPYSLQAEDLWPVCFLLRPYSAHMTEKVAATVSFHKGLKLKLVHVQSNPSNLSLYNSNLLLTRSKLHFPSDHFLYNFTLDNSNYFLFPLKVWIITNEHVLYYYPVDTCCNTPLE